MPARNQRKQTLAFVALCGLLATRSVHATHQIGDHALVRSSNALGVPLHQHAHSSMKARIPNNEKVALVNHGGGNWYFVDTDRDGVGDGWITEKYIVRTEPGGGRVTCTEDDDGVRSCTVTDLAAGTTCTVANQCSGGNSWPQYPVKSTAAPQCPNSDRAFCAYSHGKTPACKQYQIWNSVQWFRGLRTHDIREGSLSKWCPGPVDATEHVIELRTLKHYMATYPSAHLNCATIGFINSHYNFDCWEYDPNGNKTLAVEDFENAFDKPRDGQACDPWHQYIKDMISEKFNELVATTADEDKFPTIIHDDLRSLRAHWTELTASLCN